MDRNKDGIQELDGALRDRFLRLMESESLADCIMVKARVEHGVRSVDILRPGLAVLLEGEKDVRCSDGEWVLRPGLLNVMCAGTRMDVVSRPDPVTGRYLTLLVPLCEEVLAAARLLWGTPAGGSSTGPMLRCVAVKDFSGGDGGLVGGAAAGRPCGGASCAGVAGHRAGAAGHDASAVSAC